jgi:light-regulated signal transduction histidine kinase (bacteriophytochrome)
MEQDCRVLTTGQMVEVAQDVLRTPGGERFLHTRKLPIADEAGRPRYLLGISEDITERRRAELKIMELHSALELRARQLEETNQELESFSYSISHDLRSPLRAIDGFSRIVEEDYGQSLDQEGLRLLGVIRDNTRRMAQLIDDLLAFSRLGRKALTLNAVDMTALAQSAWQQLCDGRAPGAVRLTIDRLPAAVGDRVLLLQVWTNLLSNAIKYSSTCDEPAISVSASSNDAEVFYCVRDNGVGFDMRYSEKLFGVFQRLHSMDEFPGTGVGLAIVKRIVIRHGGRVWADSILGEGARFCFSLPRGQADGVGGAG